MLKANKCHNTYRITLSLNGIRKIKNFIIRSPISSFNTETFLNEIEPSFKFNTRFIRVNYLTSVIQKRCKNTTNCKSKRVIHKSRNFNEINKGKYRLFHDLLSLICHKHIVSNYSHAQFSNKQLHVLKHNIERFFLQYLIIPCSQ